ncbi:cytochrome P450 4c3 isoform X2 [Cimex lectularius]|uniref:Cytochrome P450 n=1 Tax=Cimex lectularius TaxID=79782 RepID=A0A8I6RUA1_CIMLE|nr:cytochrome P450 4c3 isoform X2 [Cimex lectularius]
MGSIVLFAFKFFGADFLTICLAFAATFGIVVYNWKRRRMVYLIGKIPGLPSVPLIGNTIEINVDHDEMFTRISSTRMLWGKSSGICKAWLGPYPYIFVSKASAAEAILSSSKHIEKSREYCYLHPWLGTGLLTSSGIKWQTRRKILTPTFHFRILEDFLGVFIEQSEILIKKLEAELTRESFNIFPYVTRCTLDIICAMGRKVNAQSDSESAYVKAVYKMGTIVQKRQAKIWLQPEWAFRWSKLYSEHNCCLKVLHDFSNKVIQDKREDLARCSSESDIGYEENLGVKKRLAFLDLLLQAKENGAPLPDEDIREEVDTFMFEGHDTTSAAICWILFLLGCHPDIQDKVVEEMDAIFQKTDRRPTPNDLAEMKYLECCIKEALRLYPSVPIFARKINTDVDIGKYTIPKGTTAMIVAYQLHRDPSEFPDPEVFKPERFAMRDSSRHPYSYIPFSAGPRNCIGQKFAILEEKVVVSTVLRKYRVKAVDRRENLVLLGELVLRPKNGLYIAISPRD